MTIYISICDNNVADRKHIERLLEREKDKRLKENYDVLYIDSFGSEEALNKTPIKYDIFFIDITEGESNGMDVAKSLRQRGITAPIVLCESTVSYTSFVNAPKELIFIEKPLNSGQISHLIDVAMDKAKNKTPLIELRCPSQTTFINYKEFVRATQKDDSHTEVSVSDGSFYTIIGSVETLYAQCIPYKCFVMCKKDIVNVLHIDDCIKNKVKLSNGDMVSFGFFQKNKILRALSINIKQLRDK